MQQSSCDYLKDRLSRAERSFSQKILPGFRLHVDLFSWSAWERGGWFSTITPIGSSTHVETSRSSWGKESEKSILLNSSFKSLSIANRILIEA